MHGMTAIKGIIFDFNGVIVDDYELQKEAWSQISQTLRGRPVTDEEMVQTIRGVPTTDTLMWMTQGALSVKEVGRLADQRTAITRELFDSGKFFRVMPGLTEFLDDAKARGMILSIATSQAQEIFDHLFEKLELGKWFDTELVVSFDGSYPGKPAPDAYALAAKKIGLEPEECAVFEDALSGVTSAHSAGIGYIVAVGHDAQEFAKNPHVAKTIGDFTEIKASDLP
jgi:beta-phosphoglucomutase